MTMEKRFIYFSTKAKFLTATQGNEYEFTSIVFIGDSKEIWNRGIFYGTPVDFDINDYLTKSDAASTYQPKGNYLTEHQDLSEYAKTSELQEAIKDFVTSEELQNKLDEIDVTDQLGDYAKTADVESKIASAKAEVEGKIPSVEGLATETYVDSAIEDLNISQYETVTDAASKYQPKGNYLTEHQDLSEYAKKAEVTEEIQSEVKKGIDSIVDGATEAMDTLKEVEEALKTSKGTVDALNQAIGQKASKEELASAVEDMATKTWVNGEGFLKEHQSLADYAKKSEIPSLEGYLTEEKAGETYPTKSEVSEQIAQAVSEGKVDLTGYAKESWVNEQGFLKEHQSLAEYAKKSEVTSEIAEAVEGLSETYYSKSEVDEMFDWAEY